MPFKISACVIVYHPEETIEQNIQSYINNVEKLYLIDNSETTIFKPSLIPDQHKIQFIQEGKNEGVAKRLNEACNLALHDGFDYLLTMDQDSFFDEHVIKKYFNCVDNFKDKTFVSMFGINHEKQTSDESCLYKNTTALITSGSIINLLAYKKIGLFDENLFIDFIDSEYCFRSIQKGFNNIEFSNIYLHHKLGEAVEKRSVINLKKTKRSFHSALRLYYMTRNFLYINEMYKNEFPDQLNYYKKDILNRIKNKLLYHSGRYITLQYLYKAFKDYRNNKMGKQ